MIQPQDLDKLAALVAEKIAANAPAATPRLPRAKRRQEWIPASLSEEEMTRLLNSIASPRDKALFTLAYHRGWRASEPGLVDLGDYNPSTGKLTFRRLKGSRGGEYLLLPAERTALKAWLKRRGHEPGPLFLSRKHGRLTRIQVFRLMRRYCQAAGIGTEKAHPHALKHSCAMHLSAREEDIVAIQDHMGHADIRSTMRYIHVTSARRHEFARKLEANGWGKK